MSDDAVGHCTNGTNRRREPSRIRGLGLGLVAGASFTALLGRFAFWLLAGVGVVVFVVGWYIERQQDKALEDDQDV